MPANTPDVCRRYSRRPGANRCGISFASPASSPAASPPPSACVRQTTTSKTGLGEDCECNRPAGSEASRHVSEYSVPAGPGPSEVHAGVLVASVDCGEADVRHSRSSANAHLRVRA